MEPRLLVRLPGAPGINWPSGSCGGSVSRPLHPCPPVGRALTALGEFLAVLTLRTGGRKSGQEPHLEKGFGPKGPHGEKTGFI